MALTKCHECGHEVSSKAKRCSNCGAPVKKKPVFAIILFIFLFLCLIGYIYETNTPKDKPPTQTASVTETLHFTDPCQEHIEIISAAAIAAELGVTEASVVATYRLNLWKKETNDGRGGSVGQMLPGSRAIILEEGPDDFKVKSPLDQSIGWINKIQISRTLYQDINTNQPCKP